MTLYDELAELAERVETFEALLARRHGDAFAPPPRTAPSSGEMPEDLLVVGLVGGTGVGKSTLVNALAGRDVSSASRRRPTTDRILPFVHRDRRAALEALGEVRRHLASEPAVHDAEAARTLLILDLPDIDSVEEKHAEAVRAVLPHLDLVVWMTSITKYADRVFHDWIAEHCRSLDLDNCVFVINKIDELDPGDGPTAAARILERFRSTVAESLGAGSESRGRASFFTICAGRPGAEIAGNSLPELRELLFRERDARELRRIKSSNRKVEIHRRLEALGECLDLDRRARLLDEEERFLEKAVRERLEDRAVREELDQALGRSPVLAELSRLHFERALSGWPLLPRLSFLSAPLRHLARLLDLARLYVADRAPEPGAAPPSPLLAAIHAIQTDRRRLRSRATDPKIPLSSPVRDDVDLERDLRRLQNECDARLQEALAARRREAPTLAARPSWRKRLLIWVPPLWFPLAQPLLQEILDPSAGLASLPLRLVHRIVRIGGAAHLLVSLAFVLLVYLVVVLVLRATAHARALRECRALLETDWWENTVRERLVAVLAGDLEADRRSLDEERRTIEELTEGLRTLEERLADREA